MKARQPKPQLSLKKALLKSSSSRSMEIQNPPSTDTDEYIVEILPNLYIADYHTVKMATPLQQRGIDVIVNLISHKCTNTNKTNFNYENFEIADTTTENLLKVIEEIILRIDNHIKAGHRVVVHCFKGISRAPAVVMAYLIKMRHMHFDLAFELVKKKSPRIDPNAGFLMQLSCFV